MPPRALRPQDIRTLLRDTNPNPSHPLAVCVRSSRDSDLALAALLSSNAEPPLQVLTSARVSKDVRRLIPSASVHVVHGDCVNSLRPFARWAVANGVSSLVLGDTRVDKAVAALSTIDAGAAEAFVGGRSTGLEMLPEGVLQILRPLENVDEMTLDATVSGLNASFGKVATSEVRRAVEEVGEGIDIEATLRHGERKREIVRSLCDESTQLMRSAILEASHWGYLVVRRSTLASRYHDGCAGRLSVVHAVARMVLHVSGSSDLLTLDDEQVSRLTADLLAVSPSGSLKPLPKGRTAAGMVVRPATGRFARRLAQADRRSGRQSPTRNRTLREALRQEDKFSEVEDDLMIFTREPDHESAGLASKRLRGNWASVPMRTDTGGRGVYWDNRFVMAAAPVTDLHEGQPPVSSRDVLMAALEPKDGDIRPRLSETELYVRQIRRVDWERITASVSRVRGFQIPFQCIRALPAVFQKTVGDSAPGYLVASPHLGLSAREDLYFTAVRMPRFRCLPADIEPGFSEEHFRGAAEPATRLDEGSVENDAKGRMTGWKSAAHGR